MFAVRTAMVLLSALSSTFVEHGKLQLIVFATTWVTLIHFLFVFKCKPYARGIENRVNNVTQAVLLSLLLCALGLSMDNAMQESRAFATILLTFCAALLFGTMLVLLVSFSRECMSKRAEKLQAGQLVEAASARGSAPSNRVDGAAPDAHDMLDNQVLPQDQDVIVATLRDEHEEDTHMRQNSGRL